MLLRSLIVMSLAGLLAGCYPIATYTKRFCSSSEYAADQHAIVKAEGVRIQQVNDTFVATPLWVPAARLALLPVLAYLDNDFAVPAGDNELTVLAPTAYASGGAGSSYNRTFRVAFFAEAGKTYVVKESQSGLTVEEQLQTDDGTTTTIPLSMAGQLSSFHRAPNR